MNFSLFKRYKAVAYLVSPYAILQYILLRPYGLNDTLFLIGPKYLTDLANRLPHCCYFIDLERPLSFMGKLKLCYNHILILFSSRRCKTLYHSSHALYTHYSLYCFDHVIYFEDGVKTYDVVEESQGGGFPSVPRENKLSNKLLGPIYPTWGWADKAEKLYLTEILPIPSGIANKVELLNLKELWSQRSPEEQAEICRIFLPEIPLSMLDLDREVLLLTQPFSGDSSGCFSEQDTIEMYQTILVGIDESTLLIKVHPRDKVDYKKHFPHAEILHTHCPMELLNVLGLNIKKAITINSTAIYCLDDSVEKIITGMSVTPKLHAEMIRRWGDGYEFGYQETSAI